MFVDFAGQTVPVVDPDKGEVREAQIFVAVLAASKYTYAEATWSQELEEWIGAHCRAFEFFEGVPEIIVPDYFPRNIIVYKAPWNSPKEFETLDVAFKPVTLIHTIDDLEEHMPAKRKHHYECP
ncbi:MAG: transposase [Syntrophothermus sp.]|nr:transposase [Syntrophothermus sp.]